MKRYIDLFEDVWKLNRVHASEEMEEAYLKVMDYYTNSEILIYPSGETFGGGNSWVVPDKWIVKKGLLKNLKGDVIVDFNENPLRLFTYSPSFTGEISLKELKEDHLFSIPSKPKAIPFHFRNQYRPWNRQWGFCLKHEELEGLKDDKYIVEIETEFDKDKMLQLEYTKNGDSKDRFLFIGHFDHPAMCNDGLSGCIAANEVIKRLQGTKTHYTYSSLNSVEIIGSVAYCQYQKDRLPNTKGAMFIAMSASKTPFSYQYSSKPTTYILDRAFNLLLKMRYPNPVFMNFRELVGNDEVAFEAPGINIPCSSITRWPYNYYHTSDDNFERVDEECMEEKISLVLDAIYILENNYLVKPLFEGLPCLSNPDLNLYLSPTMMSHTKIEVNWETSIKEFMHSKDIEFIQNEQGHLNDFMNGLVPLLGNNEKEGISILTIAEKFNLPFKFVHLYLNRWVKKGLLELGKLTLD